MELDITEIKLSKKDLEKGIHLPESLSPELAYLCGIIVGDGSIYYRKDKKDYALKVVGNPKDERELYDEVISVHFKKVFEFIPNFKFHDSNTTYGFMIQSKSMMLFLTEKIGLLKGKKDENLCIPEIFKVDDQLIKSFIRGLFDTDGCMCFKKRYKLFPYYPVISLSSSSKKLISEVALYLKSESFKVVEIYDYKILDSRFKNGFSMINRVEMNGRTNLR